MAIFGGVAGSDGAATAARDANVLGEGGAGAFHPAGSNYGTGGGGGGGYYGGGGGGTDGPGGYSGSGGGGSGTVASIANIRSTSTNVGDGFVTISYALTTTTSGVLRAADTGDAIPNSCVVFSPVSSPGMTNYDSVGGDGTWSFTTGEQGPFNLAFYTTATGDCSQPILPKPVPSWYINQPLTGTDEHIITPPLGASAVSGGTTGIVACLGMTALPTAACAVPRPELSGTVVTTNDAPVSDVCVLALTHDGATAVTLTDAAGHWSLADYANRSRSSSHSYPTSAVPPTRVTAATRLRRSRALAWPYNPSSTTTSGSTSPTRPCSTTRRVGP